MKKVLFEFVLNENEKIVITTENEDDFIHCCYEVEILFYMKDKKYLLAKDSIKYLIECFNDSIKKLLKNELLLDSSIVEDIGFLSNKRYSQENSDVSYDKNNLINRHLLWSYESSTWLYNNKNGEIVLHYTPSFPCYLYIDDETDDRFYKEYEKWIKNYQSIFTKIIPRKVAERWLEQTEEILEKIKQNIEQERRENEPDNKND